MRNKKLLIWCVAALCLAATILAFKSFLKNPTGGPSKAHPKKMTAHARRAKSGLGIVTVNALNSRGAESSYQVRILSSASKDIVVTASTNMPLELAPGVYDIEVSSTPPQAVRGVRVEANRPVSFGFMTGRLTVKTADEDRKAIAGTVAVIKADTKEPVLTSPTNQAIDIAPGVYDLELQSKPKQTINGAVIDIGRDTTVEFTIQR